MSKHVEPLDPEKEEPEKLPFVHREQVEEEGYPPPTPGSHRKGCDGGPYEE